MRYYNVNYSKKEMEPDPWLYGKSRLEIDESKNETINNNVIWKFGIVDRESYDIGIFYVKDRAKETLIPIIKNNIYTYEDHILNNEDENPDFPATWIYSNCFTTYQISHFKELGYILYKVNHSVWFGKGSFHTNMVGGIWSRIIKILVG